MLDYSCIRLRVDRVTLPFVDDICILLHDEHSNGKGQVMPLKQMDNFQLEQAEQLWNPDEAPLLHKNTTITPS